jgi:hypothetical protein
MKTSPTTKFCGRFSKPNRTVLKNKPGPTVWSFVLALVMTASVPASLYAQLECLPQSRVDCSTRFLNIAPPFALYSEVFGGACLMHDYCYRFGADTYGYSRSKCDGDFLKDMKDICDPEWWELPLAGFTVLNCRLAATAYHKAVSLLGDSAYHDKTEGQVCQYEQAFGDKRRPLAPYGEYWILLL